LEGKRGALNLNSSVSSVTDLLACLFVFIAGLLVIIFSARKLNISESFAMVLYSWHTLFCYAYVVFVVANGGDAEYYFEQSQLNNIEFSIGTAAITYITRFFSYYLGLSFLATNLAFNIVGAIGLLYFYAALKFASENKSINYKRLAIVMVMLPSCSFWSSALGKDAISFLSVTMAVWAVRDFKTRILTLSVAIAVMCLVRIHIGVVMVLAVGMANLLHSRRIGFGTVVTLIGSLIGGAYLLPVALGYVGLEINSLQDVSEYIGQRQGYNQEGGGAVDSSQLSLPAQLLTYLLRPTLIEVTSAFQFISALENTLISALILLGIKYMFEKRNVLSAHWFYTIYVFIAWFLLATTTSNLGIAARQKWMIMPAIVMIVFAATPPLAKRLGRNQDDRGRLMFRDR
jgi:hypothetical protein